MHYAERPYWATWLRAAGLDPAIGEAGPRFSESTMTLAAAEAGQGLAIGRLSLVADALRSGTLVRPFEETVTDGVSYFLVTRPGLRQNSMVRAFSDWLMGSLAPVGTAAHPPTRCGRSPGPGAGLPA